MGACGALLNSKSDKLDHDFVGRIPLQSLALSLGLEPVEDEVTVASRSMANAKAVSPNELPVELLKLGRRHEPTLLREFHRVMKIVWREGRKAP